MTMKLLLDTNVLVDYFAQRAPFARDVNRLNVAKVLGDVELWACPHSFPDISYILRRALPQPELQQIMRASLETIKVCTVTHEDVAASLAAGWDNAEDALVSRCADRLKADYLITRDQGGFSRAKVPVLSPRAWLQMMRDEHGIVYDEI